VKLKGLERSVKRGVFTLAAALSRDTAVVDPYWLSRVRRVLLLRYDRIGDMLIATGLIRAITASNPSMDLDVLASPSNRAVLDGNPHVRRVHVFDRRSAGSFVRTVRVLRAERYDAVIGGMLKPSATTSALMLGSGAPYRVGIADPANAFAYNIPIAPIAPDQPFARQIGEVLRAFGGDPAAATWHYDLYLRDEERAHGEGLWNRHEGSPRVLVNVSAFTEDRRWPAERYVAVIRHVRERRPDARVLVTGDPRDWATAAGVAGAAGVEAVNVSPIRNAFAFVAAADMLITPDTSLAHAASAEGIPSVILYRFGSIVFAPPGDNNALVSSRGVLSDLPVDEVIPAVDRILARC
jgi:ADP-heptose:LPS heptosyltransferase